MRFPSLLTLSFVLLAVPAGANGRFPRAQRLLEDPDDPNHLVLGATYGMLVTDDRHSFSLLCESSFAGAMLATFDCVFDRVGDGELLVSYGDAMSRASVPYCDFSRVLGGDMLNRVVDFSVLPDARDDVLAIVTRRADGGGGVSVLARSTDAGRTFEELGAELPTVGNFAVTVNRAPSLPSRAYVSGVDADNQGVLLVSDDGGAHFEVRPVPGAGVDAPPYIAVVHPSDPDTVFVRTDGFVDDEFGSRTGNDALLVTMDAGQSWQEVLREKRQALRLCPFAVGRQGARGLWGSA